MMQTSGSLSITCFTPKTIIFHLEFCPEIVENTRYAIQTLEGIKNLVITNEAVGRINLRILL